jgi:thioesterase domain-containing protein
VLGVDLPLRLVVQSPTPAELATHLEPGGGDERATDPFGPVLPIRAGGEDGGRPLWFIHSGGGLSWPYLGFAGRLPAGRPIYGIQAKGFDGTVRLPGSIAEIVADYVGEILAVQPAGPFHLAGYSLGGTLAHAIAAELQRRGHAVGLLALLDSVPAEVLATGAAPSADDFRDYFHRQLTHVTGAATDDFDALVENAVSVVLNQTALLPGFASPGYRGDTVLFRAAPDPKGADAAQWRPYISGVVHQHDIDSMHEDLMQPEPAAEICAVISRALATIEEREQS